MVGLSPGRRFLGTVVLGTRASHLSAIICIVETQELSKGVIVCAIVYQFTFCFFSWFQTRAILSNIDNAYFPHFEFTALLGYSVNKYFYKVMVKCGKM